MKKLVLLKAKVGMWAKAIREAFMYLVCNSPYHPTALLSVSYGPTLLPLCAVRVLEMSRIKMFVGWK